MIRIESPANTTYKIIKSLKERKYRDSYEEYIVEGLRISQEAIEFDSLLKYVIISDTFFNKKIHLDTLSKYDNKTICMPDKLFNDICDTKSPQGILCVMQKPKLSLCDTLSNVTNSIIILLESIQDPGNMGTIIRTSDAAGVHSIIISPDSVDIYSPKVIRSTMGSIFHIPIILSTDLHSDILSLKSNNTKIFAAHLEGKSSIFETALTTPNENTAILIGNEANGISEKTISLADSLVLIPMPGKAESLNASAAAAIIIYEALRQKLCKNK